MVSVLWSLPPSAAADQRAFIIHVNFDLQWNKPVNGFRSLVPPSATADRDRRAGSVRAVRVGGRQRRLRHAIRPLRLEPDVRDQTVDCDGRGAPGEGRSAGRVGSWGVFHWFGRSLVHPRTSHTQLKSTATFALIFWCGITLKNGNLIPMNVVHH